ncbi:3-hydroxyacyl-CoA dehydrogenase type-2-like [Paramacrobiotus metropolitanus]|uniref:3-hydroxyacyl-CoA dehydrogenase type-2-like n=1 Tax=Paramacrobiotus metropolitanus TaxID=2943436 RepID=UPI0024464855|nr:3-hydroxyacyl-CoA dehydrogenase type-2-like [Paramacrobiotus metropolitanus]
MKAQVALVTGGASGLGLACVEHFCKLGVKVIAVDLPGDGKATELAKFGDAVQFMPADVTSEQDISQIIDHIEKQYGHLDVCINSAGIQVRQLAYDFQKQKPHDLQLWTKVLTVNTMGTFNVLCLAVGLMAKNTPNEDGERGVVINLSSSLGFEGSAGFSAYAASKAAINGMTLPLAREFGPMGIRVVAIAPGLMETPMTTNFPPQLKDALFERFTNIAAFPKRAGRAEELARFVQSVVETPMINAEVIRFDGGSRNP